MKTAAKWKGPLPKGWDKGSRDQFWDSLVGDVKHKVTKCIEQMKGKVDDPGAFCASLADRADPGWRSRASSDGIASELLKVAREVVGMDEQEASDILEDLVGGSDKAFRLMRLMQTATQSASGNQFTTRPMPSAEEVFIKLARRDHYSDKAIQHYIEHINGGKMPKGWKSIRGAEKVAKGQTFADYGGRDMSSLGLDYRNEIKMALSVHDLIDPTYQAKEEFDMIRGKVWGKFMDRNGPVAEIKFLVKWESDGIDAHMEAWIGEDREIWGKKTFPFGTPIRQFINWMEMTAKDKYKRLVNEYMSGQERLDLQRPQRH
jgi:hypothetical protein